jgi:exopolyphosphatase/pppGpp-phosphohydrolase
VSGRSSIGAAVDVGSNSVHLLVASVGRSRLRPIVDESVQLGLGAVVDEHGRLPAAQLAELVAALTTYVRRAEAIGAERPILLGTEPLRQAANRSVAQADVLHATGVPLLVLSHQAEAELTLLGVMRGHAPLMATLVVDIGGGSTEVIVAGGGSPIVTGALATGSARLAALVEQHDPPTWFEINALRAAATDRVVTLAAARPERGVVVGGTGTNALRLLDRPRAATLDLATLERCLVILSSQRAADLAAAHGLHLRRARQLPAGLALLEALLRHFRLGSLRVSGASLREGAVLAAARAGDAWQERLAELVSGGSGASPPSPFLRPLS